MELASGMDTRPQTPAMNLDISALQLKSLADSGTPKTPPMLVLNLETHTSPEVERQAMEELEYPPLHTIQAQVSIHQLDTTHTFPVAKSQDMMVLESLQQTTTQFQLSIQQLVLIHTCPEVKRMDMMVEENHLQPIPHTFLVAKSQDMMVLENLLLLTIQAQVFIHQLDTTHTSPEVERLAMEELEYPPLHTIQAQVSIHQLDMTHTSLAVKNLAMMELVSLLQFILQALR